MRNEKKKTHSKVFRPERLNTILLFTLRVLDIEEESEPRRLDTKEGYRPEKSNTMYMFNLYVPNTKEENVSVFLLQRSLIILSTDIFVLKSSLFRWM